MHQCKYYLQNPTKKYLKFTLKNMVIRGTLTYIEDVCRYYRDLNNTYLAQLYVFFKVLSVSQISDGRSMLLLGENQLKIMFDLMLLITFCFIVPLLCHQIYWTTKSLIYRCSAVLITLIPFILSYRFIFGCSFTRVASYLGKTVQKLRK